MSSEKDEPPELIPDNIRTASPAGSADGSKKAVDALDARGSYVGYPPIAKASTEIATTCGVKVENERPAVRADSGLPSLLTSNPSDSLPKDKAGLNDSANANNILEESDDEWCNVVTGGSLIPPTNFGIVEEDLYRSGMPNELNFPFLEQLQLKTVIYLASDEMSDKLADFMEDQSIEVIPLTPDEDDMPAPWQPMSEEVVLSGMELLLDPSVYPIHVMCSQGRHRTGTVIGCLRKLQGWCLSSIFEEYHRHADAKGRLSNEQFIELFDTDLINIPSRNRPTWLR